jgi:purine-binding chemotaxis protein CheW
VSAVLDEWLAELLSPEPVPAGAGIAPPAVDLARCVTEPSPASSGIEAADPQPAFVPSGRWLRVSVQGDRYAIELLRVQEVVRLSPIMAMRGAPAAVLGIMNLRGRVVPVFDLGRWLGAGEAAPGDRARVVVVERDDELIGLLVSAVDDVVTLDGSGIERPVTVGQPRRRAIDRAFLGIARPGQLPTVLLDATAFFA